MRGNCKHVRSEAEKLLVGETGFEPATLCSQSRCATRLRHSPTGRVLHGEAEGHNRRFGYWSLVFA